MIMAGGQNGQLVGMDAIRLGGLETDGYQKFANNFGAGSVVLKYDSKFANANGLARVYYCHTWNSTTIDSVTLNSDGTFSITGISYVIPSFFSVMNLCILN